VSGEVAGPRQREQVLAALLDKPDTVLVAIASDGVMVPMPRSVGVPEPRVIAAPTDRATVLEIVVPADGLTVVATWERVREQGVALGTVHLRTDPGRATTLTFIDASAEHGVFLCALDAVTDEGADAGPEALHEVAVARRPRTASVRKSILAVITDVDERATRMLGWTREQMIGKRSSEFIHPEDEQRAIANWMELLSRQDSQRVRVRHRCADGRWAWLELENQYVAADDPADAVIVTQMSDVSDEMATHEALQQRERLLRRVAESLPVGILQLATDRDLVFANSRLAAILGVPAVNGPGDLANVVDEADRAALEAALGETLEGGTDSELEVGLRHGLTGEPRVCAISVVSLSDREGAPGALLTVTDVTDSARMREELTAKATFDVLTGCHNRASTMAILDQALRDTGGLSTAVLFVDLDNFKPVNDILGHDAGDELLMLAAQRLDGVLRRDDIVGRIGGDEFLIVSRGLEGPASALTMGQRVRDALAAPAVLAEGPVELSASIGIACSRPGDDAATLTKRADRAMYRSKQEGRGEPVLHSDPF
jgi:diguanylate cyclase (GGDEF)-like protein/PAS domain S-box-containing protein